MTAALLRSVNNNLLDKLMHDLRSKLLDTLMIVVL
jgi:hypothetical protein